MSELIRLTHIEKTFSDRKGNVTPILQGIDLTLEAGQTLCVVGESGCGKTTLGKILTGVSPYTGGSYTFEGKEVRELKGDEWRNFRKSVQMIHQNPYESLNPSMMVYDMIANPIKRHRRINDAAVLYKEVSRLLEVVGLTPISDFVDKYPAFLSGGQKQRVSIARILAMNPKVIIVDEATSMIDTSMRISLLKTLKDIQQEFGVAYFFITHDLALGRYFSWGHHLMVMYLGKVVELAGTQSIIEEPKHPYTKAILSAARGSSGILENISGERYELLGVDIPSFLSMPQGCSLHPRCPQIRLGVCDVKKPELKRLVSDHFVSCHLFDDSCLEEDA